MQRILSFLTRDLRGVSALWLLVFVLCLTAASWLDEAAGRRLDARVARAAEIASLELGPGLQPGVPAPHAQARALLVRRDLGFAWLRVRDREGLSVAAAARQRDGPGRWLLARLSTSHRVTLLRDGVPVGSLEFGLLVGGGTGLPGSSLVPGLLGLLAGLPMLCLLSVRLWTIYRREWSAAGPDLTAALARDGVASPRAGSPPVLPAVAGEVMAVFDRGGVVIDRQQRVCDLNACAERLTGWRREEAFGQPLSQVLMLEAGESGQAPLPLQDCLRGMRDRASGRFRLRARDGTWRELEINAGPLRDAGGRIGGLLLSLGEVADATPATAVPGNAHPLSRLLLDHALDCVLTVDSQDRIRFVNDRALENFGYRLTDLRGEHISRILPEPFRPGSATRVTDLLLTLPGMSRAAVRARRRDGSQYPAELSIYPVSLRGQQGHAVAIRPAGLPEVQAALDPALQQLLQDDRQEICLADADSLHLVASNEIAQRNLGFPPAEMQNISLPRLSPRLDPDALRREIEQLREGRVGISESRQWQQRADGTSYEAQVRLSLWCGAHQSLLVRVARPVETPLGSARETARLERLEQAAHRDPLTGLAGQSLFLERLHGIVSDPRGSWLVVRLAVRARAGDGGSSSDAARQWLRAVADRLSAIAAVGDTVAHVEKDEFALLLACGADAAAVDAKLARLGQALRNPSPAAATVLSFEASVGAALYPGDATRAELLWHHAGLALREAIHQAIDRGPGQICRYQAGLADRQAGPAAHTPVAVSPQEAVRLAWEQGRLRLEMQAISDVRARRVVGAELLLAWRQPGRGLLRSAAQLRQAGADDALVAGLGSWILEQAFEQAGRWRDLELPALPLFVNLSALSLPAPDAAGVLKDLLRRQPGLAEDIVIMLNAGTLEDLLLGASGGLGFLRDHRLRLGINDVDPSRTDLLRQADVDFVQLTPASIAGLPLSREASTRTAAVIEAGQRVGAHLCASGVETAGQRAALMALGCHLQQGRLFGEPLEPREFARSLLRAEAGVL